MNEAAPPLAFEDVALVIGGARVLDGLAFTIAPGERLAIVGASGLGKSLVLRLAIGLIAPTSGTVRLFGEDVASLCADALRRLRGRCGLALQGGSLIATLSVEDNLRLALGQRATERSGRRVDRMLLDFDLGHAAARIVSTLSISEQRRVELARAFLRDPECVMLDEPFECAHADAAMLEAMVRRHTALRGRTMLLVTQDAPLAERLAERVLKLERGRVGPSNHRA